MVRCRKNHCYKMTDAKVNDIHKFKNSGMFVFEDNYDKDRKMLNDEALNELRGIVNKPITLNHCVAGICRRAKKGFIKYGESSSTIAKYDTDGITTVTSSYFVNCSDGDSNSNGMLKSNMDLCTDATGTGESKAILGVGVKYRNKLYQRTGYNVVGTAVEGYYNFGEYITKCGSSSCGEMRNEGYYINSDTNTNGEYKLIYCERDGADLKCKNTQAVENGYYWNESSINNVIVCDNSGCGVDHVGSNCSGNQKKVIYSEGYKYCYGAPINVESTLKYYIAWDNYEPESKFNYPHQFINEHVPPREILIKTQQYSVTAVTGDNIPIGYVKVQNKYLECKYNEEGKKVCVNADVTEATECTSETVGKLIANEGIKLCVDASTPISISSGIQEYIIALGNGKFGIKGVNDGKEYSIVVRIADQNVIVVKGN